MSNQLLPCPFCGGDKPTHDEGDESAWVQCTNLECGMCGPITSGPSLAAAAWNRRATQPAAGEPVYQWNAGAAWIESSERGIRIAKENGHQTRVLWTAPPAAAHGDEVDQFFEQVKAELRRARAKFPGDRIMTLALAEEFGELCKAVLDESAEAVREEAVQVACMAARVVLDGDGSVVDWRRERGLDPLLADAAMRAQGVGESV
ncbi:Lar family restriction alleviation protein [Pseudomonas sp. GM_Psu_2]|uniref:Lar family restriction alleviation protein n=1 Tax=unclassified Pseudomonas TaxID=196821 RepID=UPI00226A4DFD|nr:Lar family restriction alleviation protein [Pseudomonas sp. GM_Psu_2]